MRITLLAALVASLCPWARADEQPTNKAIESKVQDVLRATDLFRAGEAFRALFQAAGDAGLGQLKLHPHDTIALQSAWQQVSLTIPKGKPEPEVRPNRRELDQFIGFLEGRARLKIPGWWRKTLADARSNGENVYFEFGKEPVYENAGLDDVTAPVGTRVTRQKGKISVAIGKQSVLIPQGLLGTARNADTDEKIFYCSVSGRITPTRCYVAVHGDSGNPYPVTCIDRSSGTIRWKAKVWAAWPGAAGVSEERVTVTEQDERIIVYGVATSGAYAEAFRAKDGKNLFRFSTYH